MNTNEYPVDLIKSSILESSNKEKLIGLDTSVVPDSTAITENDVSYHSEQFGCKPSNYYKYITKCGIVYYNIRWNLENDKKETRPYIFSIEKNKWLSKGFPAPRPLYNLSKLIERPNNPVLIVEGEKTADAASLLLPDYVVITSCGGSNASCHTDWSVLKNRDVVISPDHDEAGQNYFKEVKDLCIKAGVNSLKRLLTEKLGGFVIKNNTITKRQGEVPKGYDLADSLADGWTETFIHQAINDEIITPLFHIESIEETIKNDECESELIGERYNLQKDKLLYKVFIKDEDGKKSPQWHTLCGYLKVTHQIRDTSSSNWGVLIELIDKDNKKKEIKINREQLTNDKAALELLLNQGLEIATIKKFHGFFIHDLINEYINICNPTKRATTVDKVGWHDEYYIMPFIDNPKNYYSINAQETEEYILQSSASNQRKLTRKGTLEGWQNTIGRLSNNNTLLIFSIAAALTAPLLKILGKDGCCFHFSGSSSIGKTTTLYVANSVWGLSKPSSFRTTDNGAESLCKNSNDGFLSMDDIGEVDPIPLERITYLFGNGTGKARSKKNGDAQAITTFRILGLSTGEIGLQAKLAEKGKSSTAGQNVRFIEIPADSGKGLGIFDTLHNFESGSALSDHLRALSDPLKKESEDCGVLIDAFMQLVVENSEEIKRSAINSIDLWLKKYLPANSDPQVERVAKRFAEVAAVGEIAIDAQILPFEELSVSTACGVLFHRWLEQRGSNRHSHEFQGIIERLRKLTQEGINSRFLNSDGSDDSKNIKDVAGYKKIDYKEVRDSEGEETIQAVIEFWIYPKVSKREILENRNEKVFYKQLIEAGYIIPDKQGKSSQIKRPAGKAPARFIVVPTDKINEEEHQ